MLNPKTLEFLHDLSLNNSKSWFDQNRKRYDQVKEDYLGLAANLLEKIQVHDTALSGLSPKDCIFRINRDVRFSSNKAPYKTNLGIAFHPGGKKFQLAAYYLHIELGGSFVGGGLWMPEALPLAKIRKEIHFFYPELTTILSDKNFTATYGSLDVEENQKLSRPPKGYEANNPAIEFLKLKSFTASHPIADDLLTSNQLIPTVIEDFITLKPFLDFLNRGLLSDNEGGL